MDNNQRPKQELPAPLTKAVAMLTIIILTIVMLAIAYRIIEWILTADRLF